MSKWWMIRAGDDNELIPIWIDKRIASIGWERFGNPKDYRTKVEFLNKVKQEFTESNPQSINSWVSQVWRFSHEIENGDKVITYSKEKREYLIGTVTSSHKFNKLIGHPDYPNVISVDWYERTIERDKLSQSAKNSLGSTLTVFRVDDWGNELEKLLHNPQSITVVDEEEEQNEIVEDLIDKATVLIQDKVDKLDPWEMQELIGGLLVAMGYNVQISPKGPDGGVDILAFKDAFGFEKPIIKVQVKHRKNSASAPEIQQLLGANPIDANALFVSTGGFTSHAEAVAKHNSVRLVDLEEIVELINNWYEKMPNDVRSLLPLKKMYLPE
ncbi:restriction endonuclease [Bacillus sp. DNRA2]|uniref:restriction endonuclease n=1 Tax=Bacillus sp. DNRA2 TaxID=2723053 RepID=UPI00145C8D2B|nr:restriction endonuclease [Bacillus sp. DNRA2]NMD72632.1 restriction endonuclease [Bacillus sp. DNRA2]